MIINDNCLNVTLHQKPNLIITDPPYYVLPKGKKSFCNSYDFQWDSFKNLDDFLNFTNKWLAKYYNILDDNSFMFVFWSQKYLKEGLSLFNPSRTIMWHYKNLTLGGGGDFSYDYEPIFVIKKGNPKLVRGKHSSILEFTKPQSNFKRDKLVHPTQKPLNLIKYLIEISNVKSKDSPLVLDMFCGSGTTLKAAKDLSIQFIGIEQNSNYIKLIIERLKD